MDRHKLFGLVFRETSLRWRIVVMLLSVSLVPLVLVWIGSWIVFGRLLNEKAYELLNTVVHDHARSIESYLEKHKSKKNIFKKTFIYNKL